MEHRWSGLEKSVEDVHGAMSDWGTNEGIDSLPVGENVTTRVVTKVHWANELGFRWNLIQKSSSSWRYCGANLGAICFKMDFFIFLPFWQFNNCFGEENESGVCRKAHGWIPHIFIFVSVYFEPILSIWARRKSLMSTRKKYVYLCYFGFGSKCSLRGGRVSRANRVNRWKPN